MPLIIEDEGKLLGKKQAKVPDKLVNKIKRNLNLFGKYKQSKGFKRASSIVDDGYNKRSDKKDKIHNGDKTLSFSDIKKIDHEYKNMSINDDDVNAKNLGFILPGGNDMKNWAHDTLRKMRTSVKKVKGVPPVPKLEKNPVKPKDVNRDIKMGNATVKLTESNDDDWHPIYDYMEDYDIYYVLGEFFDNPKGKQNWGVRINPEMYAKALREFTQYGKLINFPAKYVYQWMGIIMKNTVILEINSELAGHREYCPYDEVADYINSNTNAEIEPTYKACEKWFDENGFYDWLEMPDGHFAVTDYGTEPLFKIIKEYNENLPPEKVLVLVNRALDVYHMQGPICSIFIEGGTKSLDKISESIKKSKKIIIDENKLLLLKEYHAQQVFNFDDEGNAYFEKNNWEHYIDFLEEIGKYGILPPSEWNKQDLNDWVEKVKEDVSLPYNGNDDLDENDYCEAFCELVCDTFIYHPNDKEDVFEESFLSHFYDYEEFKQNNNYYDECDTLKAFLRDTTDILDDAYNLDDYLTVYGYKKYQNALKEIFLDKMNEYDILDSLKYNDRGLIYVERTIKIPNFNSPDFKSKWNPYENYYKYLNDRYYGIGNCFSWEEGRGEAYCGSSFDVGTSEITLKCWVDPKNVNWRETIYRNCYQLRDEREIFINDGVPIEVFDIVLENGYSNGTNVSNKSLLKQPIIVKT